MYSLCTCEVVQWCQGVRVLSTGCETKRVGVLLGKMQFGKGAEEASVVVILVDSTRAHPVNNVERSVCTERTLLPVGPTSVVKQAALMGTCTGDVRAGRHQKAVGKRRCVN
jgi:hypothetical protein